MERVQRIKNKIKESPNTIFKVIQKQTFNQPEIVCKADKTGGITVSSNPIAVKNEVFQCWNKIFHISDPTCKTELNDWSTSLPQVLLHFHNKLNKSVSTKEIKKAIARLKNQSVPRETEITNKMLKYVASASDKVLEFICSLFNQILKHKYIPKLWTNSLVRLIFKENGNPNDPLNYRPISLLPVEYKLFTSILNQRLMKTIERFSFYPRFKMVSDPTKKLSTVSKLSSTSFNTL